MKLNFLLFILTLFCIQLLKPVSLYSQTNYKEGVVITNEGDTLSGKIDNRDWSRSPSEINFILNSQNESVTYPANYIQEFSIGDLKYISRTVTIDTTPFKVSQVREILPSSKEKRVFLKVLVKGELSLYQYTEARENFYIEENGVITELISHEYVADIGGKLLLDSSKKEKYIDQLGQLYPNCNSISKRLLDYTARKLIWFVENCNQYEGNEASIYSTELETVSIKINPYLGFGAGNVEYKDLSVFSRDNTPAEAETEVFVAGVKLLFFLPNSLNQRAVTASLDITSYRVGELDSFEDYNSTNFRIGYLILANPGIISPYFEGGLFFSARRGEYYKAYDDESFLLGFNVTAGVKIRPFNIGISIETANKRIAEVKQTGVSFLFGIGL